MLASAGSCPSVPVNSGFRSRNTTCFLLGRLPHQVIVHQQVLVGQIAGTARLGDHVLVQGDQTLDIDDGVGLAGPDGVDGLAVGVIEALVVIIAQLVDPQGQIYLSVLLQGQGLQQGILLSADGQRLFSPPA